MTWETVPLGELLAESAELQGQRTALEPLTLTEGRGFILQSEKFKKRVALEDTSRYKVVRRGWIAYNPYLLWAGAIAQNNRWEEAVVSPAYPVFVPKGRADTRYLWHMLQAPLARAEFDAISFGAIPRRRRAAQADFLRVRVPLPPLTEQRRIAAILDEADALRSASHKRFESANAAAEMAVDELVRAAPLTKPLSELVGEKFRNGISPSKVGQVTADVLTLSAITRGRFDESARKTDSFSAPHGADKLVRAGLHLICRGNGNPDLVGAMTVATKDLDNVAFPDTMIAMRPSSEISSAALSAAWRTDAVRDQIKRVARTTNGTYKINQQGLGAIRVPVGSADQQRQIGLIEGLRESNAITHGAALALADELFSSLQDRAFRGEL